VNVLSVPLSWVILDTGSLSAAFKKTHALKKPSLVVFNQVLLGNWFYWVFSGVFLCEWQLLLNRYG